jgi:hypothetical protein
MIGRRHVFYIGGYDPIVPEKQFERFRRSLSNFERTWNVATRTAAPSHASPLSSSWNSEAWGPNWKTDITFETLRWDDLVLQDSKRPMFSRLVHAGLTLIDFVRTGTFFRYVGANWKYAAFFLFPYFFLALFALGGVAVAGVALHLDRLHGVAAASAGILIAGAVFLALLKLLGERLKILHALDDGIFSRQFLYGQRPEMTKRIEDFTGRIVEAARQSDSTEIIIVGHSLGAAFAIEAVAGALRRDPEMATRRCSICILTVGATIPKFALHPAGGRMRRATKRVAAERSIRWTEYHARDDAISFYRFDPVSLKRLGPDSVEGRPNIRRVQLHTMMHPASFRRHRFNFMRMHYQFVMGNERQSDYDYCMMICGPLAFEDVTLYPGAVGRFGSDGSVLGAQALGQTAAAPAARTGNADGLGVPTLSAETR